MDRMKRNIIANYAGTIWIAAAQILFVPTYIHYLGMEAYGLIGFYTTLQVWLMLLDFGLTPTINREMARYRGGASDPAYIRTLLHTLEVACLGIAVVGFSLVAVGSNWLSMHWFKLHRLTPPEVRVAIVMMGAVVATRWVSNFYRGALQGLQKQVWMNVAWTIFVTIRSVGVLAILAWVSPTIKAYFIFQGIVSVLEAGVMRFGVIRSIPQTGTIASSVPRLLKEHMHFAGRMTLLSILGVAISQSDKIILSEMLPLKEFGFYALATTIANGLLAVAVPVFGAITPKLTENAARGEVGALVHNYYVGTELLAILVYPLSAMLIFFGTPLITAWSGNASLSAHVAPYLPFLTLGTTFYCLTHMPYGLQLAYAWIRVSIILNAVTVALLIPTLVVLVPRYGPITAAIAWAVLNAIGLVVQALAVHRRLLPKGQNVRWVRLTVVYPSAAVIVLFCLARFLYSEVMTGMGAIGTLFYISLVTLVGILSVATIMPSGRRILSQFGAWVCGINCSRTLPPSAYH